MRKASVAVVLIALVSACGGSPARVRPVARAEAVPVSPTTKPGEAMLSPWAGRHGGVPPFASVTAADFEPAFESAMSLMRAEVERIASDAAAPTFENTIAALEDAGRAKDRVETVYGVFSSTMSTPAFQEVERKMAPRLAAFDDEIAQNTRIFQRVEAVYTSPDKAKLSAEQQRLAWRHYTNLVRAGAKLGAPQKARVAAINARLATLFTSFSQNVLADEDTAVFVDRESDLEGLPDSVKAGAVAAAFARGQKGKWAFVNTRSAMEPLLTYAKNEALRQKVWDAYVRRGDNGDAHDNKQLITEILRLRAERAKLLGFATHAHFRVDNAMAKTPERAMKLMAEVWKPAVARVREEVSDMQALAKKEGVTRAIAPWDYRFYAEKVRKAKYDLDENEIKAYLELERLREGMFWVAGELFGFSFRPVSDVPVYHPDVRVWEVTDKASGKHRGLWYFDPFARPGKHSGAWMNAYRPQERFRGEVTTIVSNNANFVKSDGASPVLVSWHDATTLFHEFGHALHGLCSDVTYPSLAGTRVSRDYVEFPSQLLEHWLSTPEVLSRFALHHETKKPIPPELVSKVEKAATFNQGFSTVEYLSAALIDMKMHLAGDVGIDPARFEAETLEELGMPREIVMRHRTPQFSHVFSSDSYSAGYYSYLWADTLTADAYDAFTSGKGPYDQDVATRLRKHVFSVGDTIDPAEGFRAFRGRDVDTQALMRKRGLATKAAVTKGR